VTRRRRGLGADSELRRCSEGLRGWQTRGRGSASHGELDCLIVVEIRFLLQGGGAARDKRASVSFGLRRRRQFAVSKALRVGQGGALEDGSRGRTKGGDGVVSPRQNRRRTSSGSATSDEKSGWPGGELSEEKEGDRRGARGLL
jgi:hypothetical protein